MSIECTKNLIARNWIEVLLSYGVIVHYIVINCLV
jgi:hypothetical protein